MEIKGVVYQYWYEKISKGVVKHDPFERETSEHDWCPICPICGDETPIYEEEKFGDYVFEEMYICTSCFSSYLPNTYEAISRVWRAENE